MPSVSLYPAMPTEGCSPKRTSFLGTPSLPSLLGVPTNPSGVDTQYTEVDCDRLSWQCKTIEQCKTIRCQSKANRAEGRLTEPCASERVETRMWWCPQNPSGESRTLHHPSESVTHVPPKRVPPRQTGTVHTPSAGRVVYPHPDPVVCRPRTVQVL